MTIKRVLYMLSALLLILAGRAPAFVYAETRNIYVGDIITLQITPKDFSVEELKDKFQAFEIVDIKDEPGGYLLSIRTFETGEQKILLGDKEIVINIQSTLDDIQRDDIFEGSKSVIRPGFPFHWRVFFYIAAGILVLSGGFVLSKALAKRKNKAPSPLQLFLLRTSALSAGDDNYFVDLTFYFKEYIESLYNFRIIGKTSAEIIIELKEIPSLGPMLADTQKWLAECDRLKFTGIKASSEKMQEHYRELIDLVKKIEMIFIAGES